MNEIKHIHLGRQSFTISVEAYRALHAYLEAIKAAVGKNSNDVSEEVELRMAELLTERGIDGEKVVLPEDIDYLKEQLGEPHDFKDDDNEESADSNDTSASVRRLFRDPEHAAVAGVAAGLGAYFGIDAVIVRLLFVLLTFFGGGGILIYIILWLVVPEATTKSERLQMQGKAVTVESLKAVVDRADIPGAAERFGNGFGRGIAAVVVWFARLIVTIVGVAFVIAASAIFLGTVALGTYCLTHGVPVGKAIIFPVGREAVAALVCGIVMALCIAFMLLAAGLGVIRRKALVREWIFGAVFGLFLVAAGLGAVFTVDIVPTVRDKYNSLHHTQIATAQPFSTVDLNGKNVSFLFVPDSKYEVELQYFGDVSGVTTSVNGSTLSVNTNAYKPEQCTIFCFDNTQLTVVIHAPSLQAAKVQGSNASLSLDGTDLAPKQFTLTTVGQATAFVRNVYAGKTSVDLSRNNEEQLVLQSIGMQAQDDFVQAGAGGINLQQDGEVDITTGGNNCDGSTQPVLLNKTPGILVVNGAEVASPIASNLANSQNTNGVNAYNCILLTPTMPPAPTVPDDVN